VTSTTSTAQVDDKYHLLRLTKDYWFLVTLATSLILSLVYMLVFHVTPWDTYRQIEIRRNRVALHDRIGQRFLESGQYELAIAEFNRALALDPLNDVAQAGQYLAQLFLALPQPTWDASIWSAERDELMKLVGTSPVGHVIEKYLGDVEQQINDPDAAAKHWEKALAIKADYPDALYTLGWHHYSTALDARRMETLFRKMTEVDPYDFRGFHGLGYAIYMRAIAAPRDEAAKLMKEAAEQSQHASRLKFQQLNIIADFGEIARSVDPRLSEIFHESALKLLDDPATAKLPQVVSGLDARLLKNPDVHVYIDTDRERRAWLRYQLGLDHLAKSRLRLGDEAAARAELAAHDRLIAEARKLDSDDQMLPIYQDQLAILNQFVSARSLERNH